MKRAFLTSFLLLFLVIGGPCQGWAASPDDAASQCPQADKYRLQRSSYFSNLKEVVRAPQSSAEVKARFAELAASDKWRRQAAIISLALAGNIDLFEQLLAAGDSVGMAIYGANYLSANGNLCIDPKIEEAIVQHFHEPHLSTAFLSFFDKNLYASRAFFETLTSLKFDPANPERYGRLVKALSATRLAGLDEEMVKVGKDALAHDNPGLKRVMPGVHQALIRYFSRLRIPVFSYFRAVLADEPRSEEVVFFQKMYGQTRLAIYQALSQYESEESFAIFLEQLTELLDEPWGPFCAEDLRHLLGCLKGHRLFAEKKDQVVPLLSLLLTSPSLPEQPGYKMPREKVGDLALYDQQIRKEVYPLLAEVGSEKAFGLLFEELARLVLRPAGEGRDLLVGVLLKSMVGFPEGISFDVERFVTLVAGVQEQTGVLRAAEILARYPHEAGFRFVMDRFEEYFAESTEGKDVVVRQQLGGILFNILLQFSSPEYLRDLRVKIDSLFQAEKLSEESYSKMSSALAQVLKEDSATYQALLKAQKEEKSRQEQIAAQARWQKEMAEEYNRHQSNSGIEATIKALSGFGPVARKAGYWLIRVGPPVLPQVHAALVDPRATSELKMQLIVIAGEIGDPTSVSSILATVDSDPDNLNLLNDAFTALAKMPHNPEASKVASRYLANQEGDDKAQMIALAYFAAHRDKQGLVWARKFSTLENSLALRAVALSLAAILGHDDVKGQIRELLAAHENSVIEQILLRGLAEITDEKEYQEILAALHSPPGEEVEQMRQYVKFRQSSGQEKVTVADKLLSVQRPFYSKEALAYLLEEGEFAVLEKYFQSPGSHKMSLEMVLYVSALAQRVFVESRRLGFAVEERDGEIFFRRIGDE